MDKIQLCIKSDRVTTFIWLPLVVGAKESYLIGEHNVEIVAISKCAAEELGTIDKQTTNTGMDAISLAREYRRVCSKNNYMYNMLCEFISWVQEKQHHT